MPNEYKELFIFVSLGENGDDEGIVCVERPDGLVLPLIAGDRERMEAMRGSAQMVAANRNVAVRLLHASHLEFVDMILPPGREH